MDNMKYLDISIIINLRRMQCKFLTTNNINETNVKTMEMLTIEIFNQFIIVDHNIDQNYNFSSFDDR